MLLSYWFSHVIQNRTWLCSQLSNHVTRESDVLRLHCQACVEKFTFSSLFGPRTIKGTLKKGPFTNDVTPNLEFHTPHPSVINRHLLQTPPLDVVTFSKTL